MATTCEAPDGPTATGSEMGDLTRQLDVLQNDAAALFSMYEDDSEVYALATQARGIRDRADRIQATLALVGDALQNLEI